MCHFVKHIGKAEILSSEGKLNYEKVIEHFMKVNKCDRKTFETHKQEEFAKWHTRLQYEWQVDLGEYKQVLKINKSSDFE